MTKKRNYDFNFYSPQGRSRHCTSYLHCLSCPFRILSWATQDGILGSSVASPHILFHPECYQFVIHLASFPLDRLSHLRFPTTPQRCLPQRHPSHFSSNVLILPCVPPSPTPQQSAPRPIRVICKAMAQ